MQLVDRFDALGVVFWTPYPDFVVYVHFARLAFKVVESEREFKNSWVILYSDFYSITIPKCSIVF
jgi:hypothetical protein